MFLIIFFLYFIALFQVKRKIIFLSLSQIKYMFPDKMKELFQIETVIRPNEKFILLV